MKLVGRRSVASVFRWILGFVNVFVMLGAIATGLLLLSSFVVPDFAAGFMAGIRDYDGPSRALALNERLTYLSALLATISTWWVINRIRRIFLTVNQGDAFEPTNVGRLQTIGLGLIGVQLAGALLVMNVPDGLGLERNYTVDLGAWLGILIVFMLAEVFRQGATMRDDQQLTV